MPVLIETVEHLFPVQFLAVHQYDVIDICPIKALTVPDVALAPYQLFRGQHFGLHAKEIALGSPLQPRVIDRTNVVDRVEYDIDKVVALKYLSYPAHIM